jgi:hypothetical protein
MILINGFLRNLIEFRSSTKISASITLHALTHMMNGSSFNHPPSCKTSSGHWLCLPVLARPIGFSNPGKCNSEISIVGFRDPELMIGIALLSTSLNVAISEFQKDSTLL